MRREQIIRPLISGRRVLDIGSVGQSDKYCLWDFLSAHSGSLTGVDLPGAAESARKAFGISEGVAHQADERIVFGDMETITLNAVFDVVIAGDVIEHVSNQGQLLDNIHRHLVPGGYLVVTTPNAKWPTVVFRPNPTHMLWHDRFTLAHALERHGFFVERLTYYAGNKLSYPAWVMPMILRQGLVAVARKPV
jgi:2-polyprenyl-3-methyl-5-hydroxy-6-metoxy-1,4-benzoquinol methylase